MYWDIVNEKYYKGFPYDNIVKILGKHKTVFINYLDTSIQCTFTKVVSDGLKKYVELRTINKEITTDLYNFRLIIYDKLDNVYISNISKSSTLSGKQMVKLVELISKKMGASIAYLTDGTTVICNSSDSYEEVDLSFYLLLKNNKTYYQKMGYKLEIPEYIGYVTILPNKTSEQSLTHFLKKVNKLDLSVIHKNNELVLREIKNALVYNYPIYINTLDDFQKKAVDNKYRLYREFVYYLNAYHFLPKKGNLVKELLKLYDKNCNLYNYIIDTITSYNDNTFGYIYYFPKKYKLEEIYLLSILQKYRDNIKWNGYFVKKL